jgi:hypothetical protein
MLHATHTARTPLAELVLLPCPALLQVLQEWPEMADEFDKMAAQLVAHPQYTPSPKLPPLGVLARRLSVARPTVPVRSSMVRPLWGKQQHEAGGAQGKR